MKKNKIYGYMVGYRELGSRFVRYYTTFTYKNALSSLLYYKKSPPRERETNRPLIDPVWEIQPITKKAILRSILDEIPFLWEYRLFLCSLWLSSHRLNPKVNAKKFLDSIYFSFPNKNFYRISLTFGLRSIRTWYAHFYSMHFLSTSKKNKDSVSGIFFFILCTFAPAEKGKIKHIRRKEYVPRKRLQNI